MSSLRYIIYCRKSTESEDRQIISIESQLAELRKIAERLHLSVVEVLQESKSAKAPGRPVFAEVLKSIRKGRADGILCWKLDRLARNPIDGGEIIWMIQRAVIKHIQTFDRGYSPEDNVLVLNVEFGMANQFILDLSKNVKRGLRTKAEKGWFPGRAPLGYLNDRSRVKGDALLIKDPERFDLVRRMWDLVLSGTISSRKIHRTAVDEWGLRSIHGTRPALSTIYHIFTSTFYCGSFEYPVGSGTWHEGAHEPMVTQEEYDRVQTLLGRRGKPRPKKHSFPLLGLLSCGGCGGRITAEEKHQIICPVCRFKFSANDRKHCPRCLVAIDGMANPKLLHYLYYHCTRKPHHDCKQKVIEGKKLECQVKDRLRRIQISDVFRKWAMKNLTKENERDKEAEETLQTSRQRTLDQNQKKLDNLVELRISSLNADGSLLSDEEYARRKAALVMEQRRLQQALKASRESHGAFQNTADEVFDTARNALYWFSNGSPDDKTIILRAVGSNLTIHNKMLIFPMKKPFTAIENIIEALPIAGEALEPGNKVATHRDFDDSCARIPIVSGQLDDVRTWIRENREPLLPSEIRKRLKVA